MSDKIIMGHDSKHNLWLIIEGSNGRWKWRKYERDDEGNDNEVDSEDSFDTEENCKADAKTHGMDGRYFGVVGRGHEIEF